jgi:serine/threonine protein kinase
MPLRLLVIDGADHGRFYLLPETGITLVGNGQKHADICLHDLYVTRIHCELAVEAGQVTVTARDSPAGTLINGKKITEQGLRPGDVLRVGNSHLRLEFAEDASVWGQPEAEEEDEKPAKGGAVKLEDLGGHTLAHYELGAVLGRGQCGIVYRARDIKTDHEVALKVLDVDFPKNDPEMQAFIKILKARLPLSHPNLVTLLGAGKSGSFCWIALELVEGENLAHVIERHRTAKKIKWRRALNVALDVGRALAFLHQHHLVHGNITPNNILIQEMNEAAKLNDLLFQTALEGSALQQKTMEQKLLAELPYLAPEHVDPQPALVDELSDLYSLGVVVYAVLTGRPPFAGDSPEDTIQQILDGQPIKPKKLNKAMPDEFQAAVTKLLARHPEDRYPSAALLVADLEKLAAIPGD